MMRSSGRKYGVMIWIEDRAQAIASSISSSIFSKS